MRSISAGKVTAQAARVLRIAATTLSPDRAILLECALESEPDARYRRLLTDKLAHVVRCAENAAPLLIDLAETALNYAETALCKAEVALNYAEAALFPAETVLCKAEAVFFVEQGADCAVTDASHARMDVSVAVERAVAYSAAHQNIHVVVYKREVPGDNLRITASVFDRGTLERTRVIESGDAPGTAPFAAAAASAVLQSRLAAIAPVVAGVGTAPDRESAVMLARRAALSPLDSKGGEPRFSSAEQQLTARINRGGAWRHTAIASRIIDGGAGFMCVIPANCLVQAASVSI